MRITRRRAGWAVVAGVAVASLVGTAATAAAPASARAGHAQWRSAPGTTGRHPHRSACTPIKTFVPPRGTDNPFGIVGALGGVWFAHGGTIDEIAGGAIREFPLPHASTADAGWLAADPLQPQVWFADRRNGAIGTIDGQGHVAEVQIPPGQGGHAVPQGLVIRPDRVWFTDQTNGRLGAYGRATGAFTFYPTPSPDSQPVGLTMGGDGDLYASERGLDKVARLDPTTGAMVELTLPSGAFPNRFAVGPDGAVWLTELGIDSIVRIAPDGSMQQHDVAGGPVGIVRYRGAFYTALFGSSGLGRVSFSGNLTRTWDMPPGGGALQVTGYRGYLWVADTFENHVFRVDPAC